MRKTVITGMGVAAPNGFGVGEFGESLREGISGVRPLERFDGAVYRSPLGAEILNAPDDNGGYVSRIEFFIETAAREALSSAGLQDKIEKDGRRAVVLGTILAGMEKAEGFLAGKEPVDILAEHYTPASIAARLAARLHSGGPCITVNTACASGTTALGIGLDLIRRNRSDTVIAGGAESLSHFIISGFNSLMLVTSDAVRPYDRNRNGFVVGEGCGLIVMEEEGHARKRGAPILAEVKGYGSSSDANHITGPDREGKGLARAVVSALSDAGISAGDIDAVSGHGTATKYNDRSETLGLKRSLGERAVNIPVSSIKGMIGHTMGASGALEAAACVLTIGTGIHPPTVNYEENDPELDLDYVPNTAREGRFETVLSVSSGFAGHNAALVMEKYHG